MSFTAPTNSDFPFLPIEFQLPNNPDDYRDVIAERERSTADILNVKETALYETTELLTAQQWFVTGDNQEKRYTYRKVIDFGGLPNAATKAIVHNIPVRAAGTTGVGDPGTLFTKIYGVATHPTNTDPAIKSLPLPYVDPLVLANGIGLYVTDTNVVVFTAIDYSAFTTTYIVLEYIQNDQ